MTNHHQLVTYEAENGPRAGLLVSDCIYDIAASSGQPADHTVLALLKTWEISRHRLSELANEADQGRLRGARALGATELLAPITSPGTIFCVGANYSDHTEEMARLSKAATDPNPRSLGLKSWHFIKSSHCVVGHKATVPFPKTVQKLDWEAELAVVIGLPARNIPVERALDYVAGYTIANDLSARDLARRAGLADGSPFKFDWVAQKCFDGSCPLGPGLVPSDFVGNPQNLVIELSVNGVLKQKSNTERMIFSVAEQIAHLSERLTLWPGDVILTGTPAGVGAARGEFLKPGDIVSVKIDRLGELVNRIG